MMMMIKKNTHALLQRRLTGFKLMQWLTTVYSSLSLNYFGFFLSWCSELIVFQGVKINQFTFVSDCHSCLSLTLYVINDFGEQYAAPNHYLNQCSLIFNWTHGNELQWYFNQDVSIFNQENAFGSHQQNDGHFCSASMCWYLPVLCAYASWCHPGPNRAYVSIPPQFRPRNRWNRWHWSSHPEGDGAWRPRMQPSSNGACPKFWGQTMLQPNIHDDVITWNVILFRSNTMLPVEWDHERRTSIINWSVAANF